MRTFLRDHVAPMTSGYAILGCVPLFLSDPPTQYWLLGFQFLCVFVSATILLTTTYRSSS